MKRTNLIGVLAAAAISALMAPTASAYYDSAQGRFISRDPIGFSAGPNLYQYTRGNPVVYVDPAGLDAQAVDPVRGVPTQQCEDVCGPDVTKWFYNDLKAQLAYVAAGTAMMAFTEGDVFAARYYLTARFNFAYKWLNFTVPNTTCATRLCNDTVWLAGTCVRKNVLGNIAFGALASAPPGTNNRGAVGAGYLLGSTYGPTSSLPGVPRADNLAAFGVGDYLTNPATPFRGPPPMSSLAVFQRAIQGRMGAMNSSSVLSTYAYLYPGITPAPLFGRDTLTFTAPPVPSAPFNTRSCRPCIGTNGQIVVYNGASATVQLGALRTQYDNSLPFYRPSTNWGFESWLQTNFATY